MRKQIIQALAILLALVTVSAWAAKAPSPTLVGTWRLDTKTQVRALVSGRDPVVGTVTNGTEFASFLFGFTYISSEWVNRLNVFVTGDKTFVSDIVSGQWTPNKTAYTVTYDPFSLSFQNNDGKYINAAFYSRTDYVNLLFQALSYTPAISSVQLLSYTDSGKLTKKGQAISGLKKAVLLARWKDPGDDTKTLAGEIDVFVNYTGVRLPDALAKSTCCGSDATQNAADGQAFLTANGTQPGVQTTASGLQYIVLQEGPSGGAHPQATDTVTVNYRGFFPSGQIFDTGVLTSFTVGGVVSGFGEGLQLMTPGSKYRLFLPSALAYGEAGQGGIGPNATLIFDVELIGIAPATPTTTTTQ
jgi:hypothetical protein